MATNPPTIVIRTGPFDFTIDGVQQSSIFDAQANNAATASQLQSAFRPWYIAQQSAISAQLSALNAQVSAYSAKEVAHIAAMTTAVTAQDWTAVQIEMMSFGQTAKQKQIAALEAQQAALAAQLASLNS